MSNNLHGLDRMQARAKARDIESARSLIQTILELGDVLTAEARTERLERALENLGGRK